MGTLRVHAAESNGDLVAYNESDLYERGGELLPGWPTQPVPRGEFLARCRDRDKQIAAGRLAYEQRNADVLEALTLAGFAPALTDTGYEIDIRGNRLTVCWDQLPAWLPGPPERIR